MPILNCKGVTVSIGDDEQKEAPDGCFQCSHCGVEVRLTVDTQKGDAAMMICQDCETRIRHLKAVASAVIAMRGHKWSFNTGLWKTKNKAIRNKNNIKEVKQKEMEQEHVEKESNNSNIDSDLPDNNTTKPPSSPSVDSATTSKKRPKEEVTNEQSPPRKKQATDDKNDDSSSPPAPPPSIPNVPSSSPRGGKEQPLFTWRHNGDYFEKIYRYQNPYAHPITAPNQASYPPNMPPNFFPYPMLVHTGVGGPPAAATASNTTEASKESPEKKNPPQSEVKKKKFVRKSFEDRLNELLTYKEKFGNVDVPQKSAEYRSLGQWCNQIRFAYRSRGKTDLQQKLYNLKDSHVQELEKIGFKWSLYNRQKSFDEHFEELNGFYKKFGHCDVNVETKDYGALARWCNNIRQSFRPGMDSEDSRKDRPCRLTIENVEKLNSINFKWAKRREKKNASSGARPSSTEIKNENE